MLDPEEDGHVMDIMTVLGPVVGQQLGITLPHEHLQLDLYRDGFLFRDWRLRECDVDLICTELARFAEGGGRTILDVTPPDSSAASPPSSPISPPGRA